MLRNLSLAAAVTLIPFAAAQAQQAPDAATAPTEQPAADTQAGADASVAADTSAAADATTGAGAASEAAAAAGIEIGAAVKDKAGADVGTVKEVKAEGVVISTAKGLVQVPASGLGKVQGGFAIGLTKAEIEAAASGKAK